MAVCCSEVMLETSIGEVRSSFWARQASNDGRPLDKPMTRERIGAVAKCCAWEKKKKTPPLGGDRGGGRAFYSESLFRDFHLEIWPQKVATCRQPLVPSAGPKERIEGVLPRLF